MSDKEPPRSAVVTANAWARWEMSTFDAGATCNKAAQLAPAADTVHALEPDLSVAFEEARDRGHEEGYAAGLAEGARDGNREGHAAGQKQGYEAGLVEGHAAGLEQVRQEAAQLEALVESCTHAIGSIESEMGQALISLAINIAEQVLCSTLVGHPEKILDLVREVVLVDLGKDAVLRLRVHPDDLKLVEGYLSADPGLKNWRIQGDEKIEPGGCIAETTLGNIDATLETRWQRVAASLGRKPVARTRTRRVAAK